MQIIIDSREQRPWSFDSSVKTVRKGLVTGDYSIEGYEQLICVERKSLDDCVQSFVGGWQLFARRLRRMSAMDHAAVVVEASIEQLMAKAYMGDTLPQSVRGKIHRAFIDFGVPTLFIPDRAQAADWVQSMFRSYVEKRS